MNNPFFNDIQNELKAVFCKICPTCRERKYGREEILSIEKGSECLECSHVRGEILAEMCPISEEI